MQGRALEIVGRCTKCYGDSPKAYKREQIQPMAKVTSEYQAAYKEWPWHPRPQSMKPHEQKVASAEKTRSLRERKTTYGVDFVSHSLPKKMSPQKHKMKVKGSPGPKYQVYYPKKSVVSSLKGPKVDNAKVIHPSNSQPLQCETIYNDSYPFYDVATMTASQQSPIKGKDNIEIASDHKPAMQETEQPDAVEQPERAATAEQRKECNKGSLTNDKKDTGSQFEAISTAMADFTEPKGFVRPMPCPPPVHNHFSTVKFDGTTTFSMAYQPFPVQPYELPIWARKSKYKRPEGGMLVNTLYMHDYQPPKVIRRPSPIDPRTKSNRNIIMKKDGGDIKFEKTSTYKHDFQQWENVRPRETYQIIEVYQPPKEKMMFETNQRSHFKGDKADKMKPSRHISQHRELNTDSAMTFVTTYDETYRNPRSKKPCSGCATAESSQRRPCSAKQMPLESAKSSRPATSKSIPKPDMSYVTISGNSMGVSVLNSNLPLEDISANNSVVNEKVDILKVDQCCDKCTKDKKECTCVLKT